MEEHFGVEITPSAISDARAVCNQTRRLLKRLYQLRESDPPPVSGVACDLPNLFF